MAEHFAISEARFLEPRIHYLGQKGTGRTASEFPIIQYGIGQAWAAFGKSEWLYRAIVLALFFIALFVLFRTASGILHDRLQGAFVALFLFTSPMLAYYANNFLVNVPALSLVLLGWCSAITFCRTHRSAYIILSVALLILATLLKATAAISLVYFLMVTIGSLIRWPLLGDPFAERKHAVIALFLLVLSFFAAGSWIVYADRYNVTNQNSIFLIGILPIWDLGSDEINAVLSGIRTHLERDYFRPFSYPVLMILLGVLIAAKGRIPRAIHASLIVLALGIFSVSILFFQALKDHDYYSIDQVFIVPLFMTSAFMALERLWPGMAGSRVAQIMMLMMLIHCADFTRRRMHDRYSGWMNQDHLRYYHELDSIGPALLQAGIRPDTKVISLPDPSPNISLYLMGRKGWSDFDSLSYYPERMRTPIRLGAEYLLLFKTDLAMENRLRPYLVQPAGQFGHWHFFKLDPRMATSN